MLGDHQYYKFGGSHDWIGCVRGVAYEPVSVVRGAIEIPAAQTLDVTFFIQAIRDAGPRFFPADSYDIQFFSLRVAQAISDAALTGIEFHPAHIRLGKPGRWTARAGECPGYVWGRITGILLVDPILDGKLVQLDAAGLYLQEKLPIGRYPGGEFGPSSPMRRTFVAWFPRAASLLRHRNGPPNCSAASSSRTANRSRSRW